MVLIIKTTLRWKSRLWPSWAFRSVLFGSPVMLRRSRDPSVPEPRSVHHQLVFVPGSAARCPPPRNHVRHDDFGHHSTYVHFGSHLRTRLQGAKYHQCIWSEGNGLIQQKDFLSLRFYISSQIFHGDWGRHSRVKQSQHGPVTCGMKLPIHSQTSTVAPLKLGNG